MIMTGSLQKSNEASRGKVRQGFLESCLICRRRVDVRFMREAQGVRMCVACRFAVDDESRRLQEANINSRVGIQVFRFKQAFRFR